MYEYVTGKKGLSLERLHLLCEVAQAGGIKAAIGDDPVRQSLASRQLKELSEYVGHELCQKNGRVLEMTAAGKALADIGNDFFKKMEDYLRTTRNLPNNFSLGGGDSIFQWQILPKMKRFGSEFPSTQLVSYSFPALDIVKKVESRLLDAGIVRKSAVLQSELICEEIGEIRYKLFIPETLVPKPKHAGIPAIQELPFCTLTGDGEYARATATLLSAFNAHPSLNCSSMTQMYAAVQSGQYAAILPQNAEKGLGAGSVQCFTMPELAPFTRQIVLIYKKDTSLSPIKRSVLDFLRTAIT